MKNKIIRIGTRDSKLALWQAHKVSNKLQNLGYQTQIIPIKSVGDVILDKPLYSLGITGIFTKSLDIAMLNGNIDIAVHSMKDVPTILPTGIIEVAVLERANCGDVLVLKDDDAFLKQQQGIIATGSLRRKAQWLNRYPNHIVEDLRGNVQTRLQKLQDNNWNGAIFAAAGLERMEIVPEKSIDLSWMIPAPAQGAIMVTALEKDNDIIKACSKINHIDTQICTHIEREFLNRLEGGCTAPIGALATIDHSTQTINFKGILLNRDGSKKITISKKVTLGEHQSLGKDCADEVIAQGGKELIKQDNLVNKKLNVFSTKKLSEHQAQLLSSQINLQSENMINISCNQLDPNFANQHFKHVIITSKNGVKALLENFSKEQLHFENIYCVGRRTKELVEQHFGKVSYYAENAKSLAQILSAHLSGEKVTYFCSNVRLDTLSQKLLEVNCIVDEIEVYQTNYNPLTIKENLDAVMFYSPSTVQSFMQYNKAQGIAFCIGETTACEAQKYFKEVKIAPISTVESVIELVENHFAQLGD